MRWTLAIVVLCACGQDPAPAPMVSRGPRPPVVEEPSPLIVSPHVRHVPDDGHDEIGLRPPRSVGGGGGGGGVPDEWRPRPEPPPSEREVAAFRERLEREMGERPADPDNDGCDRYFEVMRATAEAAERPGQEMPEGPSRADLREGCRALPEAYRNCLSPEYFRDHAEECEREMEQMAARGRRRREAAERDLEAMRSGRRPWPGQQTRDPSERRPPPPEEDDEEG